MRAIWPFLLQQCVLYISQCTAAVIGAIPGHAHGSVGRGRYCCQANDQYPRSHHANRNRRVVNQKSIIYEFHGPKLDRQFVGFTNIIVIRHSSPYFPGHRMRSVAWVRVRRVPITQDDRLRSTALSFHRQPCQSTYPHRSCK
jgi:hypothetical protein